jgi:hypothetical protein
MRRYVGGQAAAGAVVIHLAPLRRNALAGPLSLLDDLLTIVCYYPATTPKWRDKLPTPEDSETGYLSYMLRMWLRRDSNGDQTWCASLQEPGSRDTQHFSNISALVYFLYDRMDAQMRSGGPDRGQDAQPDDK